MDMVHRLRPEEYYVERVDRVVGRNEFILTFMNKHGFTEEKAIHYWETTDKYVMDDNSIVAKIADCFLKVADTIVIDD